MAAVLRSQEDLGATVFVHHSFIWCGNFFAEPAPNVQLRQIGKAWHLGKMLFEKWWMAPVGLRRSAIGWAMKAGGRLYGIQLNL